MPENHEHSKYIGNPYHYDGHRLDINDLDLKAYIDARIAAASSPGGLGYLVYEGLVSQSGTNAPTLIEQKNDITSGATIAPSRFAVGKYIIATGIDINKCNYGFTVNVIDTTIWMSIDGSGNLIMEVFFLNGDGTYSPEDGDLNKTPIWIHIFP